MSLRNLSLLALYILLPNTCFAQQKKLDSLLHLLATHPQKDTLRTEILLGISSAYSTIDPQKGIVFGDSAIALAQQQKKSLTLSAAYQTQGANYAANSNNILALQCYEQALAIAQEQKSKRLQLRINNMIGLAYADMGDYPKALLYYFQALKICEDTSYTAHAKNDRSIASNYLNIGIVYKNLKQYPKAAEFYQRSLNENIRSNDSFSMAYTFSNMGTLYSEMNNKSKALEYYKRALAINKAIGNKRLISSNLFNIGSVLREMNDYLGAMSYMQQALILKKEIGNKMQIGITLGEIGIVYAYAPTAVISFFGISERQRYPTAIRYIRESIDIAIETHDLEGAFYSYNNLSEIYSKMGKYKEALGAYVNFVKFRDSVLNDAKKQEIEKQKIQYEFDKKEAVSKAENDKRNAVAQAEIDRQKTMRNISIAGACLLIIAGGISFGFYRKKREAETKVQIADTEMKALRAQMNPHFIFNSLNSIKDYISRNEIRAASDYLSSFAVLMRAILENSEEKEIPIDDDLKALECYIQLECSRMAQGFVYSISIAGDIDTETVLIPPMLLQPFVENSIWHGLSKRKEGGRLQINIGKDGDTLRCRIEDNGAGRASRRFAAGNGKKSLGMKITQSRIDALNKTRKINARISITDLPEGTSVEITLPLSYKF